MNLSITPIPVKIWKPFLYGKYEVPDTIEKNDLVKAEIIGISSYLNQPLTFHLLIDKAYLYSDLPIFSLFHKDNLQSLKLKDYICPGYDIDSFCLEALVNKNIACFDPGIKTWIHGVYLRSIDFYKDNELLHLVKINNGQFGIFPNHKINWSGKEEFEKYEKNRYIWK